MSILKQKVSQLGKRTIKHRSLNVSLWLTLPLWFLSAFLDSTLLADLASIFGLGVLFIWLWSIVGNSFEMIRLLRIASVILAIILNASWLMASLIHQFSIEASIRESLNNSMSSSLEFKYYSLAIIYGTLFSLSLSYLGTLKNVFFIEKRVFRLLLKLPEISARSLSLLLCVFIGIEIALIGLGVIGQRSLNLDVADGKRPFWFVVFEMIPPTQILLNAVLFNLLFYKHKSNNKLLYIVLFASLSITLFLYFNEGRRALVFSVIAFFYWLSFFNAFRPKLWKVCVLSLIIYPLLSQALLFSNFIRSTNSGIDNYRQSAIEVVPQAWENFNAVKENIEIEKGRSVQNLATRPLVAIPLALCIQIASSEKHYTLGENLVNSIIWTLPGPIVPNKADFPILEALLYKHFPIGEFDTANSIYLESYMEFGWLGVIVYPLILYFIWLIVGKMLLSMKYSIIICVFVIAMFFQLFLLDIGEGSLSQYTLALRSSIFLLVFYRLLLLILGRKNII